MTLRQTHSLGAPGSPQGPNQDLLEHHFLSGCQLVIYKMQCEHLPQRVVVSGEGLLTSVHALLNGETGDLQSLY